MTEERKKTKRKLNILGTLAFVIAPLACWGAIVATNESPLFASISRMIWYKGVGDIIFRAMLVIFVPMIICFFGTMKTAEFTKKQYWFCGIFLILSCVTLFIGAMVLPAGDGVHKNTDANIWHGILSLGGIAAIYVSFWFLTLFMRIRGDSRGARLLMFFLIFALLTGVFAVLYIVDKGSYVGASAVAESYVLILFNVLGYMAFDLATRYKWEREALERAEQTES